MAYTLKAFLSVGPYINNAVGQTAKFCELSDLAQTFSKEKGQYISAEFPGRTLTSFSSLINSVAAPAPSGYTDSVHRVLNHALQIASINGNTAYTRDELLTQLVALTVAEADEFDCGLIVNDGVRWMPEWLSWKVKGQAESSNRVTVWLTDEAFRGQFDEYSITVIPPLSTIDAFFQSASNVLLNLQAVTADDHMDRVQEAKGSDPETAIRALTFKYVDPLNPTTRINAVWTVLVYGAAGDNPDAIKVALFDYILSHTTHTQAQWEVIFPDIFRRTEFLILPQWQKLAMEQRLPSAAIYSPVLDLNADVGMLKSWIARTFPEYPVTQLNKAMSALAHNYRSLNLVFVGAAKNRDNKFLISDWFADYIAVPTTSVDFSRMSQPTASWALRLSAALIIAESWTSTTTLPNDLRRLTRNGITMLVFTFENVNYLIYPRSAPAYVA